MQDTDLIHQRLTDLEVKASYTDDPLDRLNAVIVRQQLQLDRLLRLVTNIPRQSPDAEPGPFRSLRDELPPHY